MLVVDYFCPLFKLCDSVTGKIFFNLYTDLSLYLASMALNLKKNLFLLFKFYAQYVFIKNKRWIKSNWCEMHYLHEAFK